jgi:hypothetical protein
MRHDVGGQSLAGRVLLAHLRQRASTSLRCATCRSERVRGKAGTQRPKQYFPPPRCSFADADRRLGERPDQPARARRLRTVLSCQAAPRAVRMPRCDPEGLWQCRRNHRRWRGSVRLRGCDRSLVILADGFGDPTTHYSGGSEIVSSGGTDDGAQIWSPPCPTMGWQAPGGSSPAQAAA